MGAPGSEVKSWFELPGRPFERTFTQQCMGLDWLWENSTGAQILDFGCAEGLIGMECFCHGAEFVHGVELVPERVKAAQRIAEKRNLNAKTRFEVGDANTWIPRHDSYDIVLALAILHKLPDPTVVAHRLAKAAAKAVILRLPPLRRGWIISDRRSGHQPHDMDAVFTSHGYKMTESHNGGPFEEFVGVWTR